MFSEFKIANPIEYPATRLKVHLLGSPQVEWEGRSLAIPRRQARALLYRLAIHMQPVPREHLCYLFWPDTSESAARRNLSHLLTHLRYALPMPELLVTNDDCIALDTHRALSDTVVFEQLSTTLEAQPYPKAIRQAVDLYRGSFLTGFSLPTNPEFETWMVQEQQTWERLYLKMLMTLVEEQTTQEDHHTAIEYAQRYLAIDELAEDMHRRLILLYVAVGDRNAAMRQFEHCTTVLERELGISPLPQTRTAYEAILTNQPLTRVTPPTVWTTLPSLNAPLVGRDQAMQHLKRAYASARSGQGKFILISGESGIGKTRLMQDFVTKIGGEATPVIGAGHETEQCFPYWLLVEAFGPYLQTIDPTTPNFEPLYLAPLAGLWPELQKLLRNLPTPPLLEPNHDRSLFHQALSHLLLTLTVQSPPLILCLDDLHWADEATLSWLGYLARQLTNVPLLVLGTYRTEEEPVIATLRTELMRLGHRQEIRLEGLSQVEVLHLVRHLSGQNSGGERFSRRLHRETGGNPFFLLETLQSMFEAGVLWQDETGWNTEADETTKDYGELKLPDSIYEAIRSRLNRLSAQARQILETGAVIGHQFSLDLIWVTSGRQESEVIKAIETLLARQIIIEHDSKYRFSHELFQTVVYRDLSYGRRRLLHRRAGESLEKLRPDDTAALAWHFERAEVAEKAAMYNLQAGIEAKAMFGYTEAQAHFEHALTLLENDAVHLSTPEAIDGNRYLRIQVFVERGWVLCLTGDIVAFTRDSEEVTRLATLLDDPRTWAILRWREAYTHCWFCRYAEARESTKEGIRLSQVANDPLLEAMCQRQLGLAARELGDYPQAQRSLEKALQRFEILEEVVHAIHTVGHLSTLFWRLGEYEQAKNLACQALNRCEKSQLPLERRLPLGILGAVAVAAGDAGLARQYLLESLALARQIADRTQEIFCLGHLGWLCLRQKYPTQALEFLQTALALADRIDSQVERSWLWSGLAKAHRLIGDVELATDHARWALSLVETKGRAYDQKLVYQILAELE